MKRFEDLKSQTPTGPLFHYTSQEGLIGILSTRTIWASKIHYLNDSAEFSYSLSLINSRLSNLRQKKLIDEEFESNLSAFVHAVRKINIFVVSFSEDGDLLSQWRAYCPPMGGYSIGFSYNDIKAYLDAQSFILIKCIYDISSQEEFLDELLLELHAEYIESGEKIPNGSGKLIRVAGALKHPSFAEEREWRAISSVLMYTGDSVLFRPSKSMIIPYYLLKLGHEKKDFRIQKIIVGPTPHPELANDSISGLLYKTTDLGSTKDIVTNSSIPYRNW